MKLEKWRFYEAGWRTTFYPVCDKGQARVVSMDRTLAFIMKIILDLQNTGKKKRCLCCGLNENGSHRCVCLNV